MLIEFSVSNYRSFNQIQTLSFRATGLSSEHPSVDERNILTVGTNRYLKIVGMYGANGSGKSNLIHAFRFFRIMVSRSVESEDIIVDGASPFMLTSHNQDNSGFFQLILLIGESRYRYGFTLDEDNTIQSEWLFGPAERNETYYFKRKKGEELQINQERFKEGEELPTNKLRSDALFLTFCAAFDGEISRLIKEYIVRNITVDNEVRRMGLSHNRSSTDRLLSEGKKSVILEWMKEAGLLYADVELEQIEHGSFRLPRNIVWLTKNIYDVEGKITGNVKMNLDSEESDGTRKFYSYIGKLYRKFINGGIFISDEIDSNFHPSLLNKLICLFQNKNVNTGNAQLFFTSHDTNLMNPDFMRRDQFYFSEKSIYDETLLYSLADLKGIRNNADFARQYLSGFYGGVPILGNYLEKSDECKYD